MYINHQADDHFFSIVKLPQPGAVHSHHLSGCFHRIAGGRVFFFGGHGHGAGKPPKEIPYENLIYSWFTY